MKDGCISTTHSLSSPSLLSRPSAAWRLNPSPENSNRGAWVFGRPYQFQNLFPLYSHQKMYFFYNGCSRKKIENKNKTHTSRITHRFRLIIFYFESLLYFNCHSSLFFFFRERLRLGKCRVRKELLFCKVSVSNVSLHCLFSSTTL